MRTFISLILCLIFTSSSGQVSNSSNADVPSLGPVYVGANDSYLNFTFLYPQNYHFDELSVRFVLYDFIANDKLNPQPYPFVWVNFTNSNVSLPWVVPPVTLVPGDFIIACFEWLEASNNQSPTDTNDCILTRAAVNSIIDMVYPSTTTPNVTNTTVTISVNYPVILPYDIVNITSTLNGTILPSASALYSNVSNIDTTTFTYMNLMPNTMYSLCIQILSANSKINGTQTVNNTCQMVMTSNNPSTTGSIGATTMIMTSTSSDASIKTLSNFAFIILILIVATML